MRTLFLKPFRSSLLLAASIGLASLSLTTADQTSPARPRYVPKPTDFAIVCTVFKDPLKDGRVAFPNVPITRDAHIAIGARVDRLEFGNAPWPVGARLNFLIHSPTLMFGGEFSGQQFLLTFSPFRPKTAEDKIWFAPETEYLLRAIESVKPAKGRV